MTSTLATELESRSPATELLCEIFRDDTAKTRTVRLFQQTVGLEELEGFIQIFKDNIDWEFLVDE